MRANTLPLVVVFAFGKRLNDKEFVELDSLLAVLIQPDWIVLSNVLLEVTPFHRIVPILIRILLLH